MSFEPGDVLVPRADPWTAISRYWVRRSFDGLSFTHILPDDSSVLETKWSLDAAAPDPATVFIRPREGTAERKQLIHLQSYVGRHLAQRPRSLKKLLKALKSDSGFDEAFVEGCVRLMIAQQNILAVGEVPSIQVRLSDISMELERRQAFVSSFAHELASQAEQIGLLIGHRPTVGGYREELFRSLLQRNIPQRFHAATGFIAGIPNQMDILIYDQIDYAPLFRAGDLVVVPAPAVRAIVEVKSNLTSKELKDALAHLEEAAPLRCGGPPIFTGIFAYDGATTPNLIAAWRAFHDMGDDLTEINLDTMHLISDVGDSVAAICVLRKSLLMTTFVPTDIENQPGLTPAIVQLESFAERRAEAAVFFDILTRYLRHPFTGPLLAEGTRASVQDDLIVTYVERAYGERVWGPYELEDDEAIEAFQLSFQAFGRWLDGEAWDLATPEVLGEPF